MYNVILHFIVKTGKLGLWVLVPLFLISNTGVAYELPVAPIENGDYRLSATGAFDKVLIGHIVFDKKVASISGGKQLVRIELKLDHSEATTDHSMGFLLAKHADDPDDLKGNYEVSARAAGLSANSEGAFGFADLNALGEQPFFADYGFVHISVSDNQLLHGDLNITLRNFEGKTIEISGSFIATRSR